jgi:putative ubiquitin-RnfH superfamily antitoxin RatB of RatAB toxin-antitoxin module
MSESNKIQVEVSFGLPDRQSLIVVDIDGQASCNDVIDASGLASIYPQSGIAVLPIAIWGKPVDRGDPVKNGDRIEILRPLEIDPRDARRQLASEGQFMGGNSNPDDT